MILFVRAVKGKIDHIQLHRAGINYTPRYKGGIAYTDFGAFEITISKGDEVYATLDGQEPDEWSKANDLYRFIFGVDPVDTDTPTLGVSVTDGMRVGDKLGG
jgi:hypothetical protein